MTGGEEKKRIRESFFALTTGSQFHVFLVSFSVLVSFFLLLFFISSSELCRLAVLGLWAFGVGD